MRPEWEKDLDISEMVESQKPSANNLKAAKSDWVIATLKEALQRINMKCDLPKKFLEIETLVHEATRPTAARLRISPAVPVCADPRIFFHPRPKT